jgi:MFS family permease
MNSPVTRRLLATLFGTQSLSSLSLTSAATTATIVANSLSGEPRLAGLPSTLMLLGGAVAAYPAGRFMDQFGRRRGLALGAAVSMGGALVTLLAVLVGQFPLQLLGFAMLGLGRGALDMGRFAAAELVPPQDRARAVSWVVLGGTIGGIGVPLVVGPMSRLATQWGLHELGGPYLAAAVLYLIGVVLIWALLRPDPRDVGLRLAAEAAPSGGPPAPEVARTFRQILRLPRAQVAMAAMICGQFIMVAVMTITPLHMASHNHSLDAVSWVIAAHVMGMFGLSVLSGRLADRHGRGFAITVGALLLTGACLMAPFVQTPFLLAVALFLLGLGWNLAYVAGSSLLADVLRPGERGRIQGTNDLLVSLTAASGSLGSGVLFGTLGYTAIAMFGIVLALILLSITTVLERPQLARAEGASD